MEQRVRSVTGQGRSGVVLQRDARFADAGRLRPNLDSSGVDTALYCVDILIVKGKAVP